MRRGISLLEVLFAIFVLAVGLLGLAAMMPVGSHQVQQANHADRSVAIGTAALQELKIRDYLDRHAWVQYDFGASAFRLYSPLADDATAPAGTFMVDPLGLSRNVASGDSQYGVFPYGPPAFTTVNPAFPKLDRVSLQSLSLFEANLPDPPPAVPTTYPLVEAMADKIFRSADDVLFESPADKTLRPVIVNAGGAPQSQSQGDYSWMFMVSPQLPPAQAATVPVEDRGAMVVTIIVFHKRDFTVDTIAGAIPSERFFYLDLPNGRLGSTGGGDAQLRATSVVPDAPTAKKLLNVHQNQWIMVSGQTTGGEPVHKWYRVVSATEMQSTSADWVVDLTIAGPDWDGSLFRDMDGIATNGPSMFATVCDGIVGVFEKVIQNDEPSAWSSH